MRLGNTAYNWRGDGDLTAPVLRGSASPGQRCLSTIGSGPAIAVANAARRRGIHIRSKTDRSDLPTRFERCALQFAAQRMSSLVFNFLRKRSTMMETTRIGKAAKRAGKRLSRTSKLLVAIASLGLSSFVCDNAFAQASAATTCQSVTVPVALAEGGPKAYSVSGKLCLPPSGQANSVILTVHGATYDHHYWDWPYVPQVYSYRNFMTNAGYAVFVYDRIGDGLSSHPVSTDISVNSNGYVAHELVQALRQGQINGYTFKHVVLAGHSLGSYTSWVEAGQYRDVDAVILTGIAHKMSSTIGTLLSQDIYPAQQDPAFQNLGLDAGYLTTRPGARNAMFYYPATTDPNVAQLDEKTKQTATQTELNGVFATGQGSATYYSAFINVPIFIVDGQDDVIFCGNGAADCSTSASLQSAERPYYSASPSVTSFVVPASGHDINLEVTAPLWYSASLGWLLSTAKITP
jgi:pimeloyl-ACP methyl ester carboxylesterase